MTDPKRGVDVSKLRIDRGKDGYDTDSRSLNWYSWKFIVAIFLLLAFVLYLWPDTRSDLSQTSPVIASTVSEKSNAVNIGNVLNASGYVVAQRRAAVASKATGRLKELFVVEGDRVKKGDLLGVLENEDLKASLKEAEAQVILRKAQVQRAEADLKEATLEYDRSGTLLRSKVISQSEYDSVTARYKRATATLDGTKAELSLSEAQLEKQKVELGYTEIISPFDGTVLTKNADVGEIVAPFGSSSTARAAIVTIADMSSLQVEADVSEANIGKIYIGQSCDIVLDSFPGKVYRGSVVSIVPTVDRAKATVMTKIKFEELDKDILPEMSAKITFKIQT